MLASKIKYGYHPILDDMFNETDDVNSHIILENRVRCPDGKVCLKWAEDYKNISIILEDADVEEKYSNSSLMDENTKPLICPLDDGFTITVNIVMTMSVGDPLLERIDEIIQRIVEAGIFMQWKKSHFDKIKIRSGKIHSYSLLDYYSFTLEHMQPAFYMLLMGFCVSTVILLLELANHLFKRLKSSFFKKKVGNKMFKGNKDLQSSHIKRPRGLRRGFAAARLQELRVRTPPAARIFVYYE
jgi:hypothetical protein